MPDGAAETETGDIGVNNYDIISFLTASETAVSGAVENGDYKMADRAHENETSFGCPYFSPYNKDMITFFLTEIGRQRTLEEDGKVEGNVKMETVGESTPDCVTADESYSENNKDIFSFSTEETHREKTPKRLGSAFTAPATRSKTDVRKPYISRHLSDIISFYNSEESLLEAYTSEHDLDQDSSQEQIVSSGIPEPETPESPEQNPDKFVFQNIRAESAPTLVTTSTPKPRSKVKSNCPMMISEGSVISFYSDETSFLSALAAEDVETKQKETKAAEESFPIETEGNEEQINRDIKVFNNRPTTPIKTSQPSPSPPTELSKSNSVLVVTEEFPDIISFYNPSADDSTINLPETVKPGIEHSLLQRVDSIVDTPEDAEISTAPENEPFVVVPDINNEDEAENRDKFIFKNDRSQLQGMEKLRTPIAPKIQEKAPIVVREGSFVTFYSSEDSYNAALESSKPQPVSWTETGEEMEDAVEGGPKPDEPSSNSDIKVYSNLMEEDVIEPDFDDLVVCESEPLTEVSDLPVIEETNFVEVKPSEDVPVLDFNQAVEVHEAERPPDSPYPRDVTVNKPSKDRRHCPSLADIPKQSIEDEDPLEDIPELLEELPSKNHDYLTVLEEPHFVHVVDMNGMTQESDDDLPGLEECPDSIHESDISEKTESMVLVEDTISEDGKPIRNVQDIEHLPSIERAIDIVDALQDFKIDVHAAVEAEYLYDDDDFEKDITEEIDSLLSEAEQLIAPKDPADRDMLEEDLDHFFDDVSNPEELLLKSEPDQFLQLQIRKMSHTGDPEASPRDSSSESAIINFITQNIDKYMTNTQESTDTTSILPRTENQNELVAFDQLLDVEDEPELTCCRTPEYLDKIPQTPSVTPTPVTSARLTSYG